MKECPNCRLCFDDSSNYCPNDNSLLMVSNKCGVTLDKRYTLEQRLGKGGMGSVYRAKHVHLRSTHAVKIISPEVVQSDPSLLVRFTQEAILVASVQHPNVVSVTDFGIEVADTLYLVMEYIDGISLEEMLRQDGALTPARAFEVLKPIAMGVSAAHKLGITHRDLKPLNVMLRRGAPLAQAVKVLDFGLAKIKNTESFSSLILAKTTNLLGSPHYMPPEQWDNENVDARSDIYSIGVILYRMLTGHLPFDGSSMPNIMFQHMQAAMPSFASFDLPPSPAIEAVLQRALEKQQDKRFQTLDEMLAAYEQALASTREHGFVDPNSKTVSFREDSFPPLHAAPTQAWSAADGKGYNLPYLDSNQNEILATYFNQPKPTGAEINEQLEKRFIDAQGRAEEARTKVSQAEKLAEEFNEAQRAAETARQKFLEAQQKIEEDVRREVKAEMEQKLAAEREARERAEAEARKLAIEAHAREEAEERANQLAKTALEAQHRAQEQREIAEREARHRQQEEGTRKQAEQAVVNLAQEAADALRRYEAARKQAEIEARGRAEAEAKRKKVEAEIERIAAAEAERRQRAEEQASTRIREEASRLESHAVEAQKRAQEARSLAEMEAQKREEADAARRRAELEAKRLAEEIISAQKRIDEAEKRAQLEAEKRAEEAAARLRAEESARSRTREDQENFDSIQRHLMDQLAEAQAKATSEAELRALEHSARIKAEEAAQALSESQGKARHEISIDRDSAPNFAGATQPSLEMYSPGRPMAITTSTGPTDTEQITVAAVRPRRIWAALLAGAFAVVGLGSVLLYFVIAPGGTAVSNVNENRTADLPTPTPVPDLPARVKDKMVLIKGGPFMMGRNEADPSDERIYASQYPAHPVVVGDFYLDRTEVTNEEYAQFVRDKNFDPPSDWSGGAPPLGREKFAVGNVSYLDANAFANWVSTRAGVPCRLPTEQEWEYAARSGAKDNVFPWGDQWIPERTNFASGNAREVGTNRDETEIGAVEDMMGNLLEWTSSQMDFYPGFPAEKQESIAGKITVRGVSYTREGIAGLNKTDLLLTLRQGVSSDRKFPFLGFRLACSNK